MTETVVESVSDWQPIETAPKNGQHILLWCKYTNSTELCIARYVQAGRAGPFGPFVWKCDGDAGMIAEQIPTHWMPLPDPPK